jgi:hypothetical protein
MKNPVGLRPLWVFSPPQTSQTFHAICHFFTQNIVKMVHMEHLPHLVEKIEDDFIQIFKETLTPAVQLMSYYHCALVVFPDPIRTHLERHLGKK